jgi:predicted MPP superfamily phosphohydrolase
MNLTQTKIVILTIVNWTLDIVLVAIVLIMGCYVYGLKIEPNWLEVVPIELTLPHLTPAFDGFKIVQISDIHWGKFMSEERLTKIIDLVNQQQPDAIAITGDFVSKGHFFDPDILQAQLSRLSAKELKIAVLGNHDCWRKNMAIVKKILQESEIIELNNRVETIYRNQETLTFAGIDDPYFGNPNLPQVIEQLPPNQTAAILLVHEPDFIEVTAQTYQFDLQLSGHSHGGQIVIPWLRPLFLPRGGRKYPLGLNQVDTTLEYTNRGLGMTGIPIRFNSRPEITAIVLRSY